MLFVSTITSLFLTPKSIHTIHSYQLDDNSVLVYGAQILFSPKRKPNLKKFMLWSDSVHLMDTKHFIHGPFNYDTHDDIIKPNKYVTLTHRKFLLSFCNQFSIVISTLSTLIVRKYSLKKRKK